MLSTTKISTLFFDVASFLISEAAAGADFLTGAGDCGTDFLIGAGDCAGTIVFLTGAAGEGGVKSLSGVARKELLNVCDV